jgi:hypothetical protein
MKDKQTIFFMVPRDQDGNPVFDAKTAEHIAQQMQEATKEYNIVVTPLEPLEIHKGYEFCPYCGEGLHGELDIDEMTHKEYDMLHDISD